MPGNPPPPVTAAAVAAAASTQHTFRFHKSNLPTLDIESDRGAHFRAWCKKWRNYRLVSGLDKEPNLQQVRVLTQCMSTETLIVLENLGVLTEQEDADLTPDAVIDRLKQYADRLINVNLEWNRLTSRMQQEGENVHEYVMALRQIIKGCDTCDTNCADRAIRVQLVRGVRNQAITEALLKNKSISLTDAIDTAAALEEAQAGGQSLHVTPSTSAATSMSSDPLLSRVSAYSQQKRFNYRLPGPRFQTGNRPQMPPSAQFQGSRPQMLPSAQPQGSQPHQSWQSNTFGPRQPNTFGSRRLSQPSCPSCGGRPHTRSPCPALNAQCDFCGQMGHFRRVCRQGPQSRNVVSQIEAPMAPTMTQFDSHDEQETDSDYVWPSWVNECEQQDINQEPHLFATWCSDSSPSPKAQIRCTLQGITHDVVVLPDSGADLSAVSPEFLSMFDVRVEDMRNRRFKARAATGAPLGVEGAVSLQWTYGNENVFDMVYIMPGLVCPILSWDVARRLGLISFHFDRVPHVANISITPGPPPTPPRHRNAQPFATSTPLRDSASVRQLEHQLLSEFPDVFTNQVRVMKGEMFRINLNDDAVPFRVSASRSVPLAFKDKLKAELKLLEQQGIIEPVTHPTQWCSPVVVEPKKTGVRLCVDFTHLNKFVKREFYTSEPPAKQVADIIQSQAKYFTSLDATKGYHQCPLHPDDRDLTTFITPFGRFRYCRAPFGISSISEHYNRRMDEALKLKSTNSRRVVDDLALYDALLRAHYEHVRDVLLQCRQQGITLSREKFKFGRSKITFAGFLLSQNGYSIDPEVYKAKHSFPEPRTITDLRAFFGLVNQLAGSRDDIASLLQPLRPLLSPKNDFTWSANESDAFLAIKDALVAPPTMAFFDLQKPTRLLTDASRTGVGFVLQQLHNRDWRTVYACSRFLNEAETRYAVIELELLAICYAFRKCSHFLTAIPVTIITDHKPLIPILNSKRLDEIENPRLQRMRFYLSQYQFTAQHCKGSLNYAADALSRFPSDPAVPVIAATDLVPDISKSLTDLVVKAASGDHRLQQLLHYIDSGFPNNRSQLPESLRPFWSVRDDLWIFNGIIHCGRRVVIPESLQRRMLDDLHVAHQGVSRTQALARMFVYWPFINKDIENMIAQCQPCQKYRAAPPKPPLCQDPLSLYPFQEVTMDFFEHAGRHYLALVDTYTDWLELVSFPPRTNPTSQQLILSLLRIFSTFGMPERIRSDNGPQFTSHLFRQFLISCGISHRPSAPYYPQSNGRAENAVKRLKSMLKKVGNNHVAVSNALLMMRNTPVSSDGLSPAMKLLGRHLRCPVVPRHHTSQLPRAEWRLMLHHAQDQRRRHQIHVKRRYDATATPLYTPAVGSFVALRDVRTHEFRAKAQVTHVLSPRRLRLKLSDGRVVERDVRHVIPCRVACDATPVATRAPQDQQSELSRARVCDSPAGLSAPAQSDNLVIDCSDPPPRRSTRVRRPPDRYITTC